MSIFDYIANLAAEQDEITKIMTLFPQYQYKSNPTFQQMKQLVDICKQKGYGIADLYHMFASGYIPRWLDDIIKELSRHWKPSGNIVDADSSVRYIDKTTQTSS